jgi:hypothetical protein
MCEQAEAGVLKENARLRLLILDSRDLADRLEGLVALLERRTGRRPARLRDLREAGLWNGPLVDAAGAPFGYDAREGRVFIDRTSPMWRPD